MTKTFFRETTRLLLLLMLMLCSTTAWAQLFSHEPGNEPPADTWAVVSTPSPRPGVVPPINAEMDPLGNAPLLQPAHNGRYTDLSGLGATLIYQHLINDAAIVTVLLADDRHASGFGVVTGSQQTFDLYVGTQLVGEIKIGSVATTGSPAPKAKGDSADYLRAIMVGNDAKAGPPCGRLVARARLNFDLVFPFDPNLACSLGPGIPGQFCKIQVFGNKFGEFGPETCNLAR